MTPQQLYQYDVNGYLLIEEAIAGDLLRDLNQHLDRWEQGALDAATVKNPIGRLDDILNQEHSLLPLVANPMLVPLIEQMVERPRLKSTWVSFQPRGGYVNPHSNHTPALTHDYYYFHDRIRHNLLQCFYAFSDIEMGGGALQLIPGSHKANFPLPAEEELADMYVELPMKAGSVLLFSHDTHHRSLNGGDRTRRTVIFTYCPGVIANSFGGDGLYDSLFDAAPEGSWQKYLLRRPHGFLETYPAPAEHPKFNEGARVSP